MLAFEHRMPSVLRVAAFWAGLGLFPACAALGPGVTERAILLAEKGQTQEAARLLEDRLRERPDALRERRLLVRLYGALRNLGRARHHAELLAAQLGPDSALPWLELGHALELSHRYEEALSLYDRAAEVAPKDPSGPRTGGLRAAAWGEVEAAEPRLAEAARRDPSDPGNWHALGVVRVKTGDLAGAELAYRAGLARDHHGLDNRIGLATLALVRDDPAQALEEYEGILGVRPEFVDAHLGRSWALVRLGRFAEAHDTLARAEKLGANRKSLERQRRWLHAEQAKSAVRR